MSLNLIFPVRSSYLASKAVTVGRFCTQSTKLDAPNQRTPLPPVRRRSPRFNNFSGTVLAEYSKKISTLNQRLTNFASSKKEKYEKALPARREVVRVLQNEICTAKSRLVVIGSTMSGLQSDAASDIDLCFYTEDEKFYQEMSVNAEFRNHVVGLMKRSLKRLRYIDKQFDIAAMNYYQPFNIPLITATFKNGMKVDIQMPENAQAIRNTNLVRCYAQADERLAMVYFYFRQLFLALKIKDSSRGLFSSYQILMFVIHFLQLRRPDDRSVLPILCNTHPQLVSPDLPITDVIKMLESEVHPSILEWKSENTRSPAELIVQMVDYYKSFNVSTDRINIANGRVTKRFSSSELDALLFIYDPYHYYSICRSQYLPNAFSTAFNFISRKMYNGQLLDSFPRFPEAVQFRSEAQFTPWGFVTNS